MNGGKRVTLFRWYRHWQADIQVRGGFLSVGWTARRHQAGPVLYWSPDAMPAHPKARGPWRGPAG